MAKSRLKSKSRSDSGSFAALPHALMQTDDFRELSGTSLKVLLGILGQYRGQNNGDLSASFTMAHKWGIKSKSSLASALEILQEKNLIIKTREGKFMKPGGCCALYAITWRSIDECNGKIEISPTRTPPRKLSLERKTPSTEL